MNALAAHIEAFNEATREWVSQDPDNQCAGYLTTDLAVWAEVGVTTVEEFELYMMVAFKKFLRDVRGRGPATQS